MPRTLNDSLQSQLLCLTMLPESFLSQAHEQFPSSQELKKILALQAHTRVEATVFSLLWKASSSQ